MSPHPCKDRASGKGTSMKENRAREIEERIAELKARWPAHSVPPSMWKQLELLEEELAEAKRDGTETDAAQDGACKL